MINLVEAIETTTILIGLVMVCVFLLVIFANSE